MTLHHYGASDVAPSPADADDHPQGQSARIIIVDDDPDLRELLTEFFLDHGMLAEAVESGAALRASLRQRSCDLVLLDVMMPGENGLSILRELPQTEEAPGIIMFSALESEVDRVVALELGADDYIIKPSSPREILARVRSVLRRRRPHYSAVAEKPAPPGPRTDADIFTFAGWALNCRMRTLKTPDGTGIRLTDVEFRLLKAFVHHPQKVHSREDMIAHLDKGERTSHRTIDVNISRLRRKLSEYDQLEIIRTVRGNGYMFLPEVAWG